MLVLDRAHLNDPVTTHMRRDFSHVAFEHTVSEAMAGFRQKPPSERIIYFYVLDADGKLRGVLPTRRLLLSTPETPVADIMIRNVI
ncbi:MAG: magnesium transporter MgtE, partial [Planctomycetia bacterium]|nr:magnesium transporter MgtE [Planctomycetia bacterium]